MAEESTRDALERADSDALIAQAALSICRKPLAEALPAAVRNKAKSNSRILGILRTPEGPKSCANAFSHRVSPCHLLGSLLCSSLAYCRWPAGQAGPVRIEQLPGSPDPTSPSHVSAYATNSFRWQGGIGIASLELILVSSMRVTVRGWKRAGTETLAAREEAQLARQFLRRNVSASCHSISENSEAVSVVLTAGGHAT